ncbi:hypothetical protein MTO96_007764 [Rhipicephalus appendiculatus]
MALTEQRGYDPTTLSWSSIPTNQPEDGPSAIPVEQADIFQLVEGRRRRRKNAGGASAPRTPVNNPVTGDARVPSPKASQKSSSPVSKWTPKPTAPAARAQDIGAPSKTEAPAVWQGASPWQSSNSNATTWSGGIPSSQRSIWQRCPQPTQGSPENGGDDSCSRTTCRFGAECHSDRGQAYCRCRLSCADQLFAPVCGSDGFTYSSECRLRMTACIRQKRIVVAHQGSCALLLLFAQ